MMMFFQQTFYGDFGVGGGEDGGENGLCILYDHH